MKKEYVKIGIVLVLFILAVCLSLYGLGTPTPQPSSAAEDVFSAERAIKHVKAIAQRPHPTGSVENIKVRDYIVTQLRELGLEPEINKYGQIHNVLAVMEGSNHIEDSGKIFIVSHYDSVPEGPGASDDGVAVAAMLESLRALKDLPPLKNDIVFLFTDGEEIGLRGARAFMDNNPLADDIALVLNLEARGTGGPSIMFETSVNNGRLIQEFAKAVPYPVANSLSYEIYSRMPNDTDLTVFKDAGFPGLNFAFIFEGMNYHTKFDNIENVDMGSLQHHGSYTLSLLKHFANMDLANTNFNSPNHIYFDIMGQFLIHYPVSWAIPILVVVTALFTYYIFINKKENLISIKNIGLSLIYIFSTIAIVFLINSIVRPLGIHILKGIDTVYNIYPYNLFLNYLYYSDIFLTVFTLVTVGITLICWLVFRKIFKITNDTTNLLSTTLLIWLILGGILTIIIPGASYLFIIPLLLTLGLYLIMDLIKIFTNMDINKYFITASILMFIGIFFIFPMIYLINQAMGMNIIVPAMVLAVLPLLPVVPIAVGRRELSTELNEESPKSM
ncbi:MAG: M20/M25/M40 family metallo-hydrolase [Halanaerobiales bacterium]